MNPSAYYLEGAVGLSMLGILAIFLISASALYRRQSRPYLLITAALAALLLRPLVATGMLVGVVSMDSHHAAEHVLDVLIAVFLLGAIYSIASPSTAATADNRTGGSR